MVVRAVASTDHTAYLHPCSSFVIWESHRPVVFTDERTLLNGAVVHQSVNMAIASQTLPLVDSGFGPKLCTAQRTQPSLGGGLRPNRGVVTQNRQCLSTADTQLAEVERKGRRRMDAPKINEQMSWKNAFKSALREPESCFAFFWLCDFWRCKPSICETNYFCSQRKGADPN